MIVLEQNNDMPIVLKQGDIVYADIPDMGCSIQHGRRPVIVVSNNKANRFSPVIHVIALTSQNKKSELPTHKKILPWRDVIGDYLKEDSIALCEQILPIDKSNVLCYVGRLNKNAMGRILDGILVQFGIK